MKLLFRLYRYSVYHLSYLYVLLCASLIIGIPLICAPVAKNILELLSHGDHIVNNYTGRWEIYMVYTLAIITWSIYMRVYTHSLPESNKHIVQYYKHIQDVFITRVCNHINDDYFINQRQVNDILSTKTTNTQRESHSSLDNHSNSFSEHTLELTRTKSQVTHVSSSLSESSLQATGYDSFKINSELDNIIEPSLFINDTNDKTVEDDDNDDFITDRCHKCDATNLMYDHHCNVCKKHVFFHDHHCPWIQKCVTYQNWHWFISFLTSVLMLVILSTYLCYNIIRYYYDILLSEELRSVLPSWYQIVQLKILSLNTNEATLINHIIAPIDAMYDYIQLYIRIHVNIASQSSVSIYMAFLVSIAATFAVSVLLLNSLKNRFVSYKDCYVNCFIIMVKYWYYGTHLHENFILNEFCIDRTRYHVSHYPWMAEIRNNVRAPIFAAHLKSLMQHYHTSMMDVRNKQTQTVQKTSCFFDNIQILKKNDNDNHENNDIHKQSEIVTAYDSSSLTDNDKQVYEACDNYQCTDRVKQDDSHQHLDDMNVKKDLMNFLMINVEHQNQIEAIETALEHRVTTLLYISIINRIISSRFNINKLLCQIPFLQGIIVYFYMMVTMSLYLYRAIKI